LLKYMRRLRCNLASLVLAFAFLSGTLSAEEAEDRSFSFNPVSYVGARAGFIELEDVATTRAASTSGSRVGSSF